jgi:hypothetical protein
MATERRAQIVDGVVVNVAQVLVGAVPEAMADWPVTVEAGPGWTYDGTEFAAPVPVITSEMVTVERERRIVAGRTLDVGGMSIAVAGDPITVRSLQALGLAASLRVGSGDTTTITDYRDETNTVHQLTPPQVLALWSAATAYAEACFEASWTIKALDPIPVDYDDDSRWPAT